MEEGKRHASAFVAHTPSLKALVERRKDVFGPIGVTPESSAQAVMETIDRAPRSARWRAFGYPEYAVEFFVTAGEEQDRTGVFVKRDFLNIPTFSGERGRFVYAVPQGHAERHEDRALKASTEPILARYNAWRAVYVDEQKLGGVALLSAWVASIPAPAPCDYTLVHRDCHTRITAGGTDCPNLAGGPFARYERLPPTALPCRSPPRIALRERLQLGSPRPVVKAVHSR